MRKLAHAKPKTFVGHFLRTLCLEHPEIVPYFSYKDVDQAAKKRKEGSRQPALSGEFFVDVDVVVLASGGKRDNITKMFGFQNAQKVKVGDNPLAIACSILVVLANGGAILS